MDCKKIYEALHSRFNNHKYQLTNSYVFMWESDFFSMAKSGYVYEVEVKRTRSDFFADFKKEKHLMFKNCSTGRYYETDPTVRADGQGASYYNQYLEDNQYKHAEYCKMKWTDSSKFNIPNRFYYAVPAGLIKLTEVPDYAGLITVHEGTTVIQKDAPFMHKRKLDLNRILLDKFYYNNIDQRRVINGHKWQINHLLEVIKNPAGYDIDQVLKMYQ